MNQKHPPVSKQSSSTSVSLTGSKPQAMTTTVAKPSITNNNRNSVHTISILNKSEVIEKSAVMMVGETAGSSVGIQPSTSNTQIVAIQRGDNYNNNNNNTNNYSPIMSSRTSRNSKTSYNSIASSFRNKSNRIMVVTTPKMKQPETLFEDPLYKAKRMKKQRKQVCTLNPFLI